MRTASVRHDKLSLFHDKKARNIRPEPQFRKWDRNSGGQYVRYRETIEAGEYSDDTQLAREFALSLAEHNGFNPEDFAARISWMFQSGQIVGEGRATESAAWRIARGVHWTEAGEPAPNAGNGAASLTMRIAASSRMLWWLLWITSMLLIVPSLTLSNAIFLA